MSHYYFSKKLLSTPKPTYAVVVLPFKKGDHPLPTYSKEHCTAYAIELFGLDDVVALHATDSPDYRQLKPNYSVLITGSPEDVVEPFPDWMRLLIVFIQECAKSGLAMAGICFGMQIMCEALGGGIRQNPEQRIGIYTYIRLDTESKHLAETRETSKATLKVYCYHSFSTKPPPDAQVLYQSDDGKPGVILFNTGNMIACQCHPEFSLPLVIERLIANRVPLPTEGASIDHDHVTQLLRSKVGS